MNKITLNNNINTTDINSNDTIKLTNEQKKIYNELIKFVSNDVSNEILLIGYAGTGKTTLMAKFINDLTKNKICKRIVMAAPTHKAVNIAKSKLFPDSNEDYTEINNVINIMTIHRLLGYQSYVGIEGEKYFAKGKIKPKWSIYDLVVVDECSMLSNQIITDIKEILSEEANKGVKVIYVGDPAQLPPVNQPDSLIFNSKIKKLELDKIIRTSNQMIMELSNSHRKWIFSKKDNDIPHVGEYITEDIVLYSVENNETKKWLNEFVELLKTDTPNFDNEKNNLLNNHEKMIDNHNNNIILTWTNKKCNIYNQYVRENIFNKKNLSQWEIGEILIFNNFHRINMANDDLNKQNELENAANNFVNFYTSEQVKLIEIEQIKHKLEPLKFKINNNITTNLNDKFRKYYKKINNLIQMEIFDVYKMKIQKIIDLTDNNMNIPTYTILSIHEDLKKLNYLIEKIEKNIIKLKTASYELINLSKENNMTKCNLQSEVEKKINKLYKEFQTNVVEYFAELNYGYCITVHKSQGSTFKNVFIDMNDILTNNNINETSKCLYTSITRSSKTLKLLI